MSEKYTAIYRVDWMPGSHNYTLVKMKRLTKLDSDSSIFAALEREGILDSVEYMFVGWPMLQGETPEDVK